MRITGVVGVSVVLLGFDVCAMAAQQPATSRTLPVIVILESQLAAAPTGTAASNHRIAVTSADRAPLIYQDRHITRQSLVRDRPACQLVTCWAVQVVPFQRKISGLRLLV